MPAKLNWHGNEYNQKLTQALIKGIDVTTASSVAPAQAETPVRTGTARGSINFKPAEVTGNRVVGEFGSYNVSYFIWLEIGTVHNVAHHMLQRSADQNFPKVYDNVRAAMKEVGIA